MILGHAEPPLTPTPEEAREWLRRELAHPDYQREGVLSRVWSWIQEALARAAEGAAARGTVTTIVTMLIFAVLVAGLLALVSRARASRRVPRERRPVLGDPRMSAEELRRRARDAFADGRLDEALTEGFRALVAGQVERGTLDDLPGATADEAAAALQAVFPARHADLARAAYLFDLVRYGDRRATRDQAQAVLALEETLLVTR